MAINADKTQVVHFRRQQTVQTPFTFSFGDAPLKTVPTYKYLGVLFDEFINFESNASLLADAAGRALGAIRSKLKHLKQSGYKTFNTLFNSGVLSIADYCAAVWGTKKNAHN